MKDWAAILRSGIFGVGPGFRFVLLTLTAPSFGAVHRVAKPGRHARPCRCGVTHDSAADAHLRGVPLDLGDYDYTGQVEWNFWVGRLWDSTRSRLRQMIPSMEYAVVREWQARGALHLHVLIRVPDNEFVVPALVAEVARSVVSHSDTGLVLAWGQNSDARLVRQDATTAKAVWYLTKTIAYLMKEVGGALGASVLLEHRRMLRRAAESFRCPRCPRYSVQSCRASCHGQWGARSSVVSVSRQGRVRKGWSWVGLTRRGQREGRRAWVLAQGVETADSQSIRVRTGGGMFTHPFGAVGDALRWSEADLRSFISADAPPIVPHRDPDNRDVRR